ncbi:MAG: cysteine desulfurase family protein [Candidatus Gracilibacteria bacterium]|jgi:cysteine desulfurase
MREIYLDNAATTFTDPSVLKAMLPYFSEIYANADSLHEAGIKAKRAIDKARKTIADILNCKPEEIIFASGGTEANNLAIFGTINALKSKNKTVITSKIEHSSILRPCEKLQKDGVNVIYLDVNKNGTVKLADLEKALKKGANLVSIIYANNEIGVIQDIKEIGRLCRKYNVLFHTDACQAAEYLSLDTQDLNVDMMTINGSKIYGPKGSSILFVKNGIKLEPLIYGGGQEKDMRSGTLDTPLIVGMAEALKLAERNKKAENTRLIKLRDSIISTILQNIPGAILNGDPKNRLPNNINITFPKINGKELLLYLSEQGIYVSTGSACDSSMQKPSHVLKAIGLKDDLAQCSIRISMGKNTSEKDLKDAAKIIIDIIRKIKSNR